MASTSSSTPPCKYDVFISFSGKDIRYGFLSHLYDALLRKQINAFLDEELRKGEEISPALLKIIQESCVSIVIFSENYADSPWCLDELVKILECKDTLGQLVLPVFYHVDPADVQDLVGNFGKAFAIAKHGEQVKGRLHKVDGWEHALMEVSNLSGWDSHNIKYESKLVEKIVNEILKKFSYMRSSDDFYDHNLVGIESRVKKVEQLLNDKQVVGIWGMGGIGKTTIAQEVFRRNMIKFDGNCFVDKVRETMTKQSPIIVRDKIICQLLREKNLHEDALDMNAFIRKRLKSKKLFIVFDDVDDANHLKNLAGESDLYGEKSRIIVTSRDQQVLKNVSSKECIYEVEKLIDSEDLKLFSLHAFKKNHPKKGYMELSKQAITSARGNPLALIVLGSHLFDMEIEEWKNELEKLKGQSLKKIQDVLRISYNGLEKNEKEIFLHIACFFQWHKKYDVEEILEAFGLFPKSAMPRLINKSLINISKFNEVDMHYLLQQMGKDIVFEECKQPGGRSRLWKYEDVHHVLTTDTGTENVEGILLDMFDDDNLEISSTAFMKMCNLRFLKIKHFWRSKGRVLLPNNLGFLPQKLRYLYWDYYPLTSLPLNFCPKNLVKLHLKRSKLIQLWNGDKPLRNLKVMDLSDSKDLIIIPDLSSTAPKLEILMLRGCESLVDILSLENLSKLIQLDIECYNVTNCPEIPYNIRILSLDETGIEQLPSSIEHLSQLVSLSLSACRRLVSLPSSIGKMKCLRRLCLRGCSRLVSIPSNIGELKCLENFHLYGCSNLSSLPESIKQLSKLKWLNLSGCKRLKCIPELPSCLKDLDASKCTSLEYASTSFLFLENEDVKSLDFSRCVNLDKKVMEDVFEAHLLGQKVELCMIEAEVPGKMSYKNRSGNSLSFRLDLHQLIASSPGTVICPTNYLGPIMCTVNNLDATVFCI